MPTVVPMTLVVAGVIHDLAGRVLLTRRLENAHMGGLWEFPGGKVEDGEDPSDALVRELREELAVVVAVGRPITFSIHAEPGLRILLLFFEASIEDGEPTAVDGQEMAWVEPRRLVEYPTPPADAELVRLLAELDREATRDLR